jgi:hypothetical protein
MKGTVGTRIHFDHRVGDEPAKVDQLESRLKCTALPSVPGTAKASTGG